MVQFILVRACTGVPVGSPLEEKVMEALLISLVFVSMTYKKRARGKAELSHTLVRALPSAENNRSVPPGILGRPLRSWPLECDARMEYLVLSL